MTKAPLDAVTSGYASNVLLNSNFDVLETAFENTLSRDGTGPNFMQAQLDLNSNRIINVGSPVAQSDAVRLADLVAISGGSGVDLADLGAYTPSGVGATVRTIRGKLQEVISVKDWGATGNGATNDTAAINAAITYAKTFTNGASVYFPRGTYAVTEINLSDTAQQFFRTIRLYGDGRWASKIIPFSAGTVLLNMLGVDDAVIEGLHFDATAITAQCAIYMARSTTSTSANNNNFRDVYIEGSFSKAPVVAVGSESSRWFNCRFANVNAAANYTCFMAGGQTGAIAVAGITTVNGGTGLDGPATDNRMYGCEFYAPFTSAQLTRWITTAAYNLFGCTFIAGSVNNAQMVRLTNQSGSRWNGPLSFHGCHFEVFGTGNSVVYMADTGNNTYFGINFSNCVLQAATNGIAVTDFDRTVLTNQPILEGCTWRGFNNSPNGSGTLAYAYALFSCDINFRITNTDGTFILFAYPVLTRIEATTFVQASQRIVGGVYFYGIDSTAAPTTGSFAKGMRILIDQPAAAAPHEYVVTVSGTLGTLNAGATTGTGTIGTNTLTVNSVTGLSEGVAINIATAGGPYLVRKIVGLVCYLDINLVANVVAQAVSFSNATLVALANL